MFDLLRPQERNGPDEWIKRGVHDMPAELHVSKPWGSSRFCSRSVCAQGGLLSSSVSREEACPGCIFSSCASSGDFQMRGHRAISGIRSSPGTSDPNSSRAESFEHCTGHQCNIRSSQRASCFRPMAAKAMSIKQRKGGILLGEGNALQDCSALQRPPPFFLKRRSQGHGSLRSDLGPHTCTIQVRECCCWR